ncbi:hypothetical protein HJFPF1_09072 [Paramyrothecium foliicola]|nr:hypothetical protein HJFPF1_09072 [Paramyrothecium foliicola]
MAHSHDHYHGLVNGHFVPACATAIGRAPFAVATSAICLDAAAAAVNKGPRRKDWGGALPDPSESGHSHLITKAMDGRRTCACLIVRKNYERPAKLAVVPVAVSLAAMRALENR